MCGRTMRTGNSGKRRRICTGCLSGRKKIVVCNAPVMQLTVYTCILLISWLGARMIVADSLTTGELMSLLAYCMNILMSLMMLSMIFVMLTMSEASGDACGGGAEREEHPEKFRSIRL